MDKVDQYKIAKFSSLAKLMHWGFVFLFIYGLLKQIDSLNQLEDASLLKFEVVFASVFLFFAFDSVYLYENYTTIITS